MRLRCSKFDVFYNRKAICFKEVEPSDNFLFDYDYCKRRGRERCPTFPYEEAEDALRLLNGYV